MGIVGGYHYSPVWGKGWERTSTVSAHAHWHTLIPEPYPHSNGGQTLGMHRSCPTIPLHA